MANEEETLKSNEIPSENMESIDFTKYPITTNVFRWNTRASLMYLSLNILSFMMPAVMILSYHDYVMKGEFLHWRIYLIMIDIMAYWCTYLMCSLMFCKFYLVILHLMHKPKEGLFKIDYKDKDYAYFCYRVAVKKHLFWVFNNFCFPWAANLAFKMCNMRSDYKSTMFDGWSDVEFIDYGKNIMVGQGAVVLSSMIIGDHLLIKKIIIGDHVVLGGNSIVAPGSVVGANTTLGVWATTHINQVLEPGFIYIGRPARKYQPAIKMLEDSKKQPYKRFVDTGERIPFDVEQYVRKLTIIRLEKLQKAEELKKAREVVKRKVEELKKANEQLKKGI